jgi:hypothetical protein
MERFQHWIKLQGKVVVKTEPTLLRRRDVPNALTENLAGGVKETIGGTKLAVAGTEDDWQAMKVVVQGKVPCTRASIGSPGGRKP